MAEIREVSRKLLQSPLKEICDEDTLALIPLPLPVHNSMSRLYSNVSIEELEKIVSENVTAGPHLKAVLKELTHRNSRRARDLKLKIEKRLAVAGNRDGKKDDKKLAESPRGKALTARNGMKGNKLNSEILPPQLPAANEHGFPVHLQEMITALKEEIDAAKKNLSGSAILLSEGKLIAPVGSAFHYRFQCQRQINVPTDTPGELRPGGDETGFAVTIVEVKDLEVILELPSNIGRSVPHARLITDLTMLLLKLIERIETKGNEPHPAAARVLGFVAMKGAPVSFQALNARLNAEQRLAVGSVLGQDNTYIWGPPGTGKTQTIGEIGAQLFLRNRTLLVVSHTNTAVDEALLRIADALEGRFGEGAILRLGEPVKAELATRPDLILKRVAEKQAGELERQKAGLERSKADALAELMIAHRRVELALWLGEAGGDLEKFEARYSEILLQAADHERLSRAAANEEPLTALMQLRTSAFNTLAVCEKLPALREQGNLWDKTLHEHNRLLEEAEDMLRSARKTVALARLAEPLRTRRSLLPHRSIASRQAEAAGTAFAEAESAWRKSDSVLKHASGILEHTRSAGAIKRLWLKLPRPEDQAAEVSRLERENASNHRAASEMRLRAAAAESMLSEIISLERDLTPFLNVPSLAEALQREEEIQKRLNSLIGLAETAAHSKQAIREEVSLIEAEIDAFVLRTGMHPREALEKADAQMEESKSRRRRISEAAGAMESGRKFLFQEMHSCVSTLIDLKLCPEEAKEQAGIPELLAAIRTARGAASAEIGSADCGTLTVNRDRLSALVAQLIDEIHMIEEALKRVEEDLLANVRVLATTLTRAFMRNGIQKRMFDTVLADEASMAPIPALWASATLAERATVVVGDFRQLSPIVQSDQPMALRWLGRDVFKASGVQGAYERGENPPSFVALKEQHRMHPRISAIVNALIYDGLLRDGDSVTHPEADQAMSRWHSAGLAGNGQVILIDTSAASAWNTSVERSRVNPLSAMICMELVRTWLKPDRAALSEGDRKRILVISPYRPQAKLLEILVREDGLELEVTASTAHSFQGSEADAVVIDLVADEPHFSANLLTPAASDSITRLLNVAITRARRRLAIIADFEWLQNRGAGAFAGGVLVPWLRRNHILHDATALLQPFSGDAPEGRVIAPENSLNRLLTLLDEAKHRVLIFSPVLSAGTVRLFADRAARAVSRGVRIVVVTQTADEQRANQASHREAEFLFRAASVTVIHKLKMREKIVFADSDTVWASTFPLLGETTAQGFCLLRHSRKFALEAADMARIELLIAPYNPNHECPVCGKEMVAADTRDGNPFYWRCVESDCYTRDMDSSTPVDGFLPMRCGTAPVFACWRSFPHWICTCGQNPPHRLKMHRNHLKLPKMRGLIPQRSWNKVCREVGFRLDTGIQTTMFLE